MQKITPVEIKAGEVLQVSCGTTSAACRFTSNNAYVASVLQNGKIIANAPGFAEITVSNENGEIARICLNVRLGKVSFPILFNRYQYVPHPAGELAALDDAHVRENAEVYLTGHVLGSFYRMCGEAEKDNIRIIANSGYRSVADQIRTLKHYIAKEGESAARKRCAPPGYSEHHSGLAIDVGGGYLQGDEFVPDSASVYAWIGDNCHRFGFMVKNLPGKESITGTIYEPWHIRYVGDLKLANHLHNEKLTLDEYLDQTLPVTRKVAVSEIGYRETEEPVSVSRSPGVTVSVHPASGKPVVTWKAVPGATEYEVYRSTSKNGAYTKMYTTTGTKYVNTNAQTGEKYYYRVVAVCGASGVETVKAVTCALESPGITVEVDASTGKPVVTWNEVPGASRYEVYRSTGQNGEYKRAFTTVGTRYTNTGAELGVTYYYKVRAICEKNSAANSAFSEVRSATCSCVRPEIAITVDASIGKPVVTWNAVPGAAGYEVYRSASENGKYRKMFTTAGTMYVNTNAKIGTTYYYKVRAICGVNSAGSSAYSEVKSIACACAQPRVTITLNSGASPRLKWTAVPGATEYEVYRATSEDGEYTKVYTTTGTRCGNTGAENGVRYCYKVIAVCGTNREANSAYSKTFSVSTE